jgi:hypothetical protein
MTSINGPTPNTLKHRATKKLYYETHKAELKKKSQAYTAANYDRVTSLRKAYAKEYYKKNKHTDKWAYHPEKARRSKLKSLFGLSQEDYNSMFQAQRGVCGICEKPETILSMNKKDVKKLAVDHCHSTHKVRGLLCHHCNTGIGHFQDSSELLAKAKEYLDAACE